MNDFVTFGAGPSFSLTGTIRLVVVVVVLVLVALDSILVTSLSASFTTFCLLVVVLVLLELVVTGGDVAPSRSGTFAVPAVREAFSRAPVRRVDSAAAYCPREGFEDIDVS